jgi:hypothetical protein
MKRLVLCLGLLLLATSTALAQPHCPCGTTCDCGPNCQCDQKPADPVVVARAMLALSGPAAPQSEERKGEIGELSLSTDERAGDLTLAPVCRLFGRIRARLRGGSESYTAADDATYSINGQACSPAQAFSAYALAPAGASYPVTFQLAPGTATFRSMSLTTPQPAAAVDQALAASQAASALKALPAPARAAGPFDPPATPQAGSKAEYEAAWRLASEQHKALVVFVRCPLRQVENAVCVRWDGYGEEDADVRGAAVVVGLWNKAGQFERVAVHPQGVGDAALAYWARLAVSQTQPPAASAAPAGPVQFAPPIGFPAYTYTAADGACYQCAGGSCNQASGRRRTFRW